MAEKITFDDDRDKTIIRTPNVTGKVVRWDWDQGREKDTFDITPLLVNVNWQKTIKTPSGGLNLTCVPQIGDTHLLDYLNTMDIVQIYEFDTLKFQGFIQTIQGTGSIDPKGGKPTRMVQITAKTFGSLFVDGELGLNLYLGLQNQKVGAKMIQFAETLADTINADGSTFSDIIKAIVDAWYTYLDDLGAKNYRKYLERYVDYETAMVGKATSGAPRSFQLFNPTAQKMSLWSVIQQVCEPPFNEVWFDNGPRKVYTEKTKALTGPMADTDMPAGQGNEKTYMIVRSTPFNGTVVDGNPTTLWDDMPSKIIPLGYLTKFSLTKSMNEAYTFYVVKPSSVDLNEYALISEGAFAQDIPAFNKYLFRPMEQQQFFARFSAPNDTKKEPKMADIFKVSQDGADTLKNWYENNDVFLSGTFNIMVPSDPDHDPRIGEKIEFEGLPNMFFYVEGVAHSWNYGGPVTSTLTVTRGYGQAGPIELKDKIFRRGIFAMNGQFSE